MKARPLPLRIWSKLVAYAVSGVHRAHLAAIEVGEAMRMTAMFLAGGSALEKAKRRRPP